MKREQWHVAIGLYHELMLEDPTNPFYVYQLGVANFRLEHYNDAKSFLIRSLEIDPKNPDAYLYLGLVFERAQELDLAEAQFQMVLKLAPDYPDAKEGLERIATARLPEEEEPKFTVWQEMKIEQAEDFEEKRDYIFASRCWYELYDDDRANPLFTYRLGQILGWMSRPYESIYFLEKTLELKPDDTDAILRLGFQQIALGNYILAEQYFNEVLAIDGERTDALDGLTRALSLQGRYCAAKQAGLRRFAEGDPDYFIYKLYHRVLDHTNFSNHDLIVYVQERETDLITKVTTAQRNTFVSEFKGRIPLTQRMTLEGSFQAGMVREINLVNGTNNLFVPGSIVNGMLEWQVHSRVTVTGSLAVEHGRDTGTPNFRLGHRTRLEPAGSISYNGPQQSSTFIAYIDTLLVKRFGTGRATLMPRDTYLLQGQWNLFQNRITFNTSNFLRYYHDVADNRQWESEIWAETGYPRFGSVLFVRYTGRAGGFKVTETDYYSYKRQWEHGITAIFSRDTVLNTEVELAYHHAWQWSRDLNQPINTEVFVRKLFRGIDKIYLELRQLYRPNIRGVFHTAYYFDSTNYKTWSVKGSLNLTF